MNRSMIAAISLIIVIPGIGSADVYDGNFLVEKCRTAPSEATHFVAGVIGGALTIKGTIPEIPLCLPEVMRLVQAREVACKYLEDHPETLHYTAASSTLGILMKSFPCNN